MTMRIKLLILLATSTAVLIYYTNSIHPPADSSSPPATLEDTQSTHDKETTEKRGQNGTVNSFKPLSSIKLGGTLPITPSQSDTDGETIKNSAQAQTNSLTVGNKGAGAVIYERGGETTPVDTSSSSSEQANTPTEKQTPKSHRISGIRSTDLSNNSSPGTAIATATPSLSPTPTPTLTRVGGQSRGYALLHLMHPHARVAVDEQIQILKRSQLNEVYLGVLVDGTFFSDFDYLESVVQSLSEDKRILTLGLYLTNGPAMRSAVPTTSPSRTGGTLSWFDPTTFRYLIRFDPPTRATFRDLVENTLPILELNRALNPLNKNYVIPMLEDNLDRESYKAMREIIAEVIEERGKIMRNPCPSCFEGNDAYSFGDPIEVHAPSSIAELNPGDGYTLDGTGLRFPGEGDSLAYSPEAVTQLEALSVQRGLAFFGLWRLQRQGLTEGKIDPFLRNYEVPTEEQAAIEIDILRSGLTEVR